jgi:hypothetical protein
MPEKTADEVLAEAARGLAAALRATLAADVAGLTARVAALEAKPPPPDEEVPDDDPPPPDPSAVPVLAGVTFTPEHNAVRLAWPYVPGAADYSMRDPDDPTWIKFTAGYNVGQANGTPASLVVEAWPVVGPYVFDPEHDAFSVLNGTRPGVEPFEVDTPERLFALLGTPLARSAPVPVHAAPHPALKDPDTVFFEDWAGREHRHAEEFPFPADWVAPNVNVGHPFSERKAFRIGGVEFYDYSTNERYTSRFAHKAHMMTVTSDGPTAPYGEAHSNYSAQVIAPPPVTLAPGGYVELEFSVDACVTERIWFEATLLDAADPLLYPNETKDKELFPSGPGGRPAFWAYFDRAKWYAYRMDALPDGRRNVFAEGPVSFDNPDWWRYWRTTWNGEPNGRNNPRREEGPYYGNLDNRSTFRYRVTETWAHLSETTPRGEVIDYRLDYAHAPLPPGEKRWYVTDMVYHTKLMIDGFRDAGIEPYRVLCAPYHHVGHWGPLVVKAGKQP